MEDIQKIIRGRRSVRTFDGRALDAADLEKLSSFFKEIENPYGVPVAFKFLDAKKQELSCPVVSGTSLFVGAKVPRIPQAEEAFGYSFEMLVLYAQSLGIGTVWVGGTMDRPAFERAMDLHADERMPCMSPLGYPAKKMSLRESMMRKAVKADQRSPFETLFFDGAFDTPLTKEKAGRLTEPLEMVRRAPSAVNKQPWRAVFTPDGVHFYLRQSKGFVSDAVGNMQKVDLGIALCHFALMAKENGIGLCFHRSDPGIPSPADTQYIASYLFV